MKPAVFVLVVLASFGTACSNNQSTTTPTTPTTPTPAIQTDTFTSNVTRHGATSHGFVVNTAGTVSVTLLSAGPPPATVGLGLGIPNGNGANCNLGFSVNTMGGQDAQITATVDPGLYCVDVYDVGMLTGDIAISVKIVHP
jgi:hypothetical protein